VYLSISRLVFIHIFSLKQAFMSYRYFHITFIIFGYFLCFSTLDHRSIGGICIAYFYKNFVFLATTSPLYRWSIYHFFYSNIMFLATRPPLYKWCMYHIFLYKLCVFGHYSTSVLVAYIYHFLYSNFMFLATRPPLYKWCIYHIFMYKLCVFGHYTTFV